MPRNQLFITTVICALIVTFILLTSISKPFQGESASIEPSLGESPSNKSVNATPGQLNSASSFYENDTYGIETNYPTSWSIQESNLTSVDSNYLPIVTFFSPTSIGSDEIASSIKIARETIGNISLSDHVKGIVNQSKQDSPDFILLSSKVNETVPGYRLYAFDKFDGRDSYILELGQLLDDKIYSVTYIADAIKYTEHLPLVQSTVDSLKLSESQSGQVSNFVSIDDTNSSLASDTSEAASNNSSVNKPAPTNSLANNENVSAKKNINYAYLSQWGTLGKARGQMIEPADLALSQEQTVYIADKGNNRIDMFNLNGTFVGGWGSSGSGEGQFDNIGDVAVDREDYAVFVLDINNNRIEKFDVNGSFLSMWGSKGTGEGEFEQPGDIAINTNEYTLFVTDIGNHRIQKFDLDGNFISTWGSLGSGDGQFDRPAGIWFDPKSEIVFVADTNNNRIQKFDTNGTFIGKWGSSGTGNGQFDNPASVSVSPYTGYVFVADSGNKRVQEFDHDGNFVAMVGTSSTDNGLLKRPVGIAFDNTNKLYVLDKDSTKVLIFGESSIQQPNNAINNIDVNPVKQSKNINSPTKDKPNVNTGSFKLTVDLIDTGNAEVGKYPLLITISGDHESKRSKSVDISKQICPGDYTSKCYTPAGIFTFEAADAPSESKIKVCVENPFKNTQNCESKNKINKGAMTIKVSVSDKNSSSSNTSKPKPPSEEQNYKININLDNIQGWLGGVKFSIENSDNGASLGDKTFNSNYINSLEEDPAVSISFDPNESNDGDKLTVCADQSVGLGHSCGSTPFIQDQQEHQISLDFNDFTLKDNSSDK